MKKPEDQMIIARPTPRGAGVILWGNPHDLDHLRDTIYDLADSETLGTHISEFLLALAYDVRHAFQGDRLEEKFDIFDIDGVNDKDGVIYRGAEILWPYYLVQVGLLRHAASFKPTTNAHHADLYRLEHATEQALLEFDPIVGKECISLIPVVGDLPRNYITEFINLKTRTFITQKEDRFKTLPHLLKSLWWFGDEYKAFEKEMKEMAAKGGHPSDLEDLHDWPDFDW